MSKNQFLEEVNQVAKEIPTRCFGKHEVSNEQKWMISLLSAVLFALVSLPILYKTTNRFIPGIVDRNGTPTMMGVLVHSFVFLLIVRLVMKP